MVGTIAGCITAVIVLEVAVVGKAQLTLEVTTQVTTSPLFKLAVLKVEVLTPTLIPFTFQS